MNTPVLPFSPASERNKGPILDALERVLPRQGTVLEIGAGTGQHAVHFGARLPYLQWQASDRAENLPGLRLRIGQEGSANVLPPITLDVLTTWPEREFAAIYSANTAHIMSWKGVSAMFVGVASHLGQAGVFCLYGPFNDKGAFTAASNAAFHEQLRSEDPDMGLRDIADLEKLAADQRLRLAKRFSLPANNQLLVFDFAADGGRSGSRKTKHENKD